MVGAYYIKPERCDDEVDRSREGDYEVNHSIMRWLGHITTKSWNMTINCSVELGAAGKRPARADYPHLDPKGKLYVLLQP